QAGNVLRHWGGKDGDNYQWASSNHGIHVDYKGNVWLGGNGGGREPVMDGLITEFTGDGKFLLEVRKRGVPIGRSSNEPPGNAKQTLGAGSAWDIAFSRDAQQKYIYLADGTNEKVYIVERQSLQLLTSFGDGGRQPGQFFGTHSIATDSKGNIYTTETYEGKR